MVKTERALTTDELNTIRKYAQGLRSRPKDIFALLHDLELSEDKIRHLRVVLSKLLHRYIELVESGDCGHWDPHAELEVVEAKAALEQE